MNLALVLVALLEGPGMALSGPTPPPAFTLYLQQFVNLPSPSPPTLNPPDLPFLNRGQMLLAGLTVAAVLDLAFDPMNREAVLHRLELITSPNHAAPENKGPFHVRSWQKEFGQKNHLDRCVHFMIPHLLTRHLTHVLEYGTQLDRTKSLAIASTTVAILSIADEYVDGIEQDEGFSPLDFLANLAGVLWAWVRERHGLDFVEIYWDYPRKDPNWKWAWWNNMDAYVFTLRINLLGLFQSTSQQPQIFRWWKNYLGYFPYTTLLGERQRP